jgi:hypothetical protein
MIYPKSLPGPKVTIKSRLSNKSTTILDASGGGGFSEMVLIMSVAFVVP